ncbi:MAG: hypothetical protein KIH69_010375 [Anaerolineae bacterium]|nr:hypothetical protein [Anaerolineae bacterium]
MHSPFIHLFSAAQLPGLLTKRYHAFGPTCVYRAGQVEVLAYPQWHTICGVGDTFFNDLYNVRLATAPARPLPLAISIQANANDDLVNLTFWLQVQVSDMVKAATWALRVAANDRDEFALKGSEIKLDAVRDMVSAPLEKSVDTVTHRYRVVDLNSEQARAAVWRAVRTQLALKEREWGIAITPAEGAASNLLMIEPARVSIAKAERLAEMAAALDRIEIDKALDSAQRQAEKDEMLRSIAADYGDQTEQFIENAASSVPNGRAEADTVPTVAPAPVPSPPSPGPYRRIVDELVLAFESRTQRELRRRAADIIHTVSSDLRASVAKPQPPATLATATLAPASSIVLPAPSAWHKALNWFKLPLILMFVFIGLYSIYRLITNSMADSDKLVTYLRDFGGAIVGIIGVITGFPRLIAFLLDRKRAKALPAPAPQVWPLAERVRYDATLRSQVLRQLAQSIHAIEETRKTIGKRMMLKEAVTVQDLRKQAERLHERLQQNQIGMAGYLALEDVSVEVFDRLLEVDGAVANTSKQILAQAQAMNLAATTATSLESPIAIVRAKLLALEQHLNERSDLI